MAFMNYRSTAWQANSMGAAWAWHGMCELALGHKLKQGCSFLCIVYVL